MTQSKIEVNDGDLYWLNNNNELHRDEDKPAFISKRGQQEFYQHGKLHRGNNLPALIAPNGFRSWYTNDCWVRDDLVRF